MIIGFFKILLAKLKYGINKKINSKILEKNPINKNIFYKNNNKFNIIKFLHSNQFPIPDFALKSQIISSHVKLKEKLIRFFSKSYYLDLKAGYKNQTLDFNYKYLLNELVNV